MQLIGHIYIYIYIYIYTSKRYSVGARLSGRTRYWSNRSVITRCNLAVSGLYISVFGKNATYRSYIYIYILVNATALGLAYPTACARSTGAIGQL